MKYNKSNSIQEIIEDDAIYKYLIGIYPIQNLDFIPKNMWKRSLEEVAQEVIMPWGHLYNVDEFLQAANMAADLDKGKNYTVIPLWSDNEEKGISEFENNKKSVCFFRRKQLDNEIKPAVIICPGGGYELLSMQGEGMNIADRMEQEGYRAFVLNYRVAPNQYPDPQNDLTIAMKFLRANCNKYKINPDKIMIMGFSAGGHLCASFAAHYKEYEQNIMEQLQKESRMLFKKYQNISVKPDEVCLCYPVISFMKEAHEPSFQALTSGREEIREKLSVERQVDVSYPKTYVWACEDDSLVPASNAIRLGEALSKASVEVKLEIFPTGEHGCTLGLGTSAEGWMSSMLNFMNK